MLEKTALRGGFLFLSEFFISIFPELKPSAIQKINQINLSKKFQDSFKSHELMRKIHVLMKITILASVILLGGCSGYAPDNRMLGLNKDQITHILGQPSTELMTHEGRVLIYPRGPFGKQTYFVYLSHDNLMERWIQVLEEKNFDQIKAGMSREEVIALIGESRISDGLAFGRGYLWSWRYVNSNCFWFRVEFTPDHLVRSTLYQKPPECRAKR